MGQQAAEMTRGPVADIPWTQRRMGTRLEGMDLTHGRDEDFERIKLALLLHSVVVIPGQNLPVDTQVAFSKRFGPLEVSIYSEFTNREFPPLLVLSNVVVDGKPIGIRNAGRQWHTDFSFMERCGGETILHAIEVPPVGADTIFADMYAAYDALDPATRAKADGRQVLHSYRLRYKDGGLSAEQFERCVDVHHPLVRTHPVAGRRALFLGCRQSAFAEGLGTLENGQAFVRELIDFATQDRFVYAHKWAVGDVLIWDNRAVMHSATAYDEDRHRRILHRTSTIGEKPA